MRSNPSSSTTLTPNDFALSSFEPAPGPATTRSVFALTDPVALPPIERTRASASSRDRRSRFPVKTIVLPAKGPPVTARGAGMRGRIPARTSLRGLDAFVDVGRALLGEPIKLDELLLRQEEEIRGIADQTFILQLSHEGPADALDVHAPARYEVSDALAGLRRARRVAAVVRDLAFGMNDQAVAYRATLGHHKLRVLVPLLASIRVDAHHLGNDISGALDHDAIALPHVEPSDLVEVVERRSADGRSSDQNRRERGDRRERADPADVYEDVLYGRRRLLGRELEGGGPPRIAGDEAQTLLVGDGVDLYDDAVGAVVERMPLLAPLVHERDDVIEGRRSAPVRVHAQSQSLQALEELVLRCDLEARRAV